MCNKLRKIELAEYQPNNYERYICKCACGGSCRFDVNLQEPSRSYKWNWWRQRGGTIPGWESVGWMDTPRDLFLFRVSKQLKIGRRALGQILDLNSTTSDLLNAMIQDCNTPREPLHDALLEAGREDLALKVLPTSMRSENIAAREQLKTKGKLERWKQRLSVAKRMKNNKRISTSARSRWEGRFKTAKRKVKTLTNCLAKVV